MMVEDIQPVRPLRGGRRGPYVAQTPLQCALPACLWRSRPVQTPDQAATVPAA
jgi:hypothetical protein